MTVFAPEGDLIAKVVVVAALAVNDRAENAFLYHVQRHQLFAAVAAVFQHHAGGSGRFLSFDQFPAILQGVSAANLAAYDFSGAHGFNGNRNVSFPRGGDHDGLDRFHSQNFVVIAVQLRSDSGGFLYGFGGVFHPVGIKIAQSNNLYVFPR